jgi:hypothetical protein
VLEADEQLSDEYGRKGFHPNWPVVGCLHNFTLDNVIASLTQSELHNPKWVEFQHDVTGMDVGITTLRVVITSLTAIYRPSWGYQGWPLGYDDRPDYRFEGRIIQEALDPERGPIFVRGYLPTTTEGEIEDNEGEIQRIN